MCSYDRSKHSYSMCPNESAHSDGLSSSIVPQMLITEYIVSSRLAGKKLAGTYIFSQLFGKDLYQHGLFMDWIE